jgi:hypothetical protein
LGREPTVGDLLVELAVLVLFPVVLPLPAMLVVLLVAGAVRASIPPHTAVSVPWTLPPLLTLGRLVLAVVVAALLVLFVASEGRSGLVPLLFLSLPVAWLVAELGSARRALRGH